MTGHRIVIVGGGAAGLSAAIAAAREAADTAPNREVPVSILLLDAGDAPGRKLLATGNGRCNLANRLQDREHYRSGNGLIPERFYQDGWDREIEEFMHSVGVLLHEKRGGYLYPRTDQAVTVVQALVRETGRLGIEVRSGVRVVRCRRVKDRYELETQTADRISADRLILAAGGMVSDVYGCMGDGYRLARSLRHQDAHPAPALCALHAEDPYLKLASGVRTSASVTLLLDGRMASTAEGELQLTDQGISGIPVFQISRFAALALSDGGGGRGADSAAVPDITVRIDFLPEVTQEAWEEECERRIARVQPGDTLGDFCRGLIPDKVSAWILAGCGLVREKKVSRLSRTRNESGFPFPESSREILRQILKDMRNKTIRITGTASFDRAQVTAGGIRMDEIRDTMESAVSPGCYLAGELLDVDGMCGGYNLTWAFHSGQLAGRSAVRSLDDRRPSSAGRSTMDPA